MTASGDVQTREEATVYVKQLDLFVRKATIPHQKRRESDDKNAVATMKFVPQLGCVSQDSDALVSQRCKQSWRNPIQKVLGSIRKVRLRYVKQVSHTRKDHRLGKHQKSSSVKSLRYEI